MTYRERKAARLERRLDWAASRDAKAKAGFDAARRIADGIPMGQPILVGHHSEKRHRRDLGRIDSGMRQGVESQDMAARHRSVAGEIERQLDRSIYDDDPDAVESLEARIAEREAQRARMVAENKAYRKGPEAYAAFCGITAEQEAARRQQIEAAYSWCRQPHPAYELSNLGGRITTDRKRLETIRARQTRAAEAEAAPGGVVIEGETWVRVTFADKPDRRVLDALKAAGFRWGKGSWIGERAKLPAEVTA